MSSSRHEALGEGLAIHLLTPLMEYAHLLSETHEGGSQAMLLRVLINDVKCRLEQTFGAVNAVTPNIIVEVDHVQ